MLSLQIIESRDAILEQHRTLLQIICGDLVGLPENFPCSSFVVAAEFVEPVTDRFDLTASLLGLFIPVPDPPILDMLQFLANRLFQLNKPHSLRDSERQA